MPQSNPSGDVGLIRGNTASASESGARRARAGKNWLMTMPNGERHARSALNGIVTAATDSAAFNPAYIDAAQRSNRLWAAGMKDLGQRCFGAAQGMTARFWATATALASAKSVRETIGIQAAHVSTEIEQSVKQATDFQEATLQLVQQASAPLIDQLTISAAAVKARIFQS